MFILNLFPLVSFDYSHVIDVKIDASVLDETSSSKMPRLSFYSKLHWIEFQISFISKLDSTSASMRLVPEFIFDVFSTGTTFYFWKSTMPEMFFQISNWIFWSICRNRYFKAVVPKPEVWLKPMAYCQNIANLSLFYSYDTGIYSLELAKLTSISYCNGSSTPFFW